MIWSYGESPEAPMWAPRAGVNRPASGYSPARRGTSPFVRGVTGWAEKKVIDLRG